MTRRNSLALHLAALAALSSVAQLPVLVGAEDLDAEDVPPECVPVCAPIVQLTARCEAQTKQRFGDIDKRFFHDDGAVEYFEARRRHVLAPERVRRRRRRMEERMGRRQVQSDSDSDSSGDEAPPQVVAAAEREEKECVCQDTSFDVFGAMNGCAGCIAANVTAVEANEDIREIMADCGFAPPPPPATSLVLTTTTSTTSPLPAVLTDPPAANPVQGGFSTLVPPALAPAGPSTSSTSSTSSTAPPPPPQDAPTSTQPPPAAATTPEPEVTPTLESSITPVTVFETPSFRTLPSLVLPNDFAAARGGRTGSGAATLGVHWVDKVAVALVLVWALV